MYIEYKYIHNTENWPARYNWNIVESGVKHHNHNPMIDYILRSVLFCSK
jgi:hypothetical protein